MKEKHRMGNKLRVEKSESWFHQIILRFNRPHFQKRAYVAAYPLCLPDTMYTDGARSIK